MSFAQEVQQSQKGGSSEAITAGMAPTIPEFNSVAPTTDQPATPAQDTSTIAATTTPNATPQAPATESSDAKKTRVTIGTKSFDTMDAALEYAQALEIENAKAEGYKDAVTSLKTPEPVAPVKDDADEISDIMFENPREAIVKIQALIEKQVEKKAAQVIQAQERQATLNGLWQDFYQKNPELQGQQGFVDHLLRNVHWQELSNIPSSQAMTKLAEIARKELKIVREAALPENVLPPGRATVAPTSSMTTPIVENKVEQAVDFVSQINKIRRRVKA